MVCLVRVVRVINVVPVIGLDDMVIFVCMVFNIKIFEKSRDVKSVTNIHENGAVVRIHFPL